MKRTMLALFLCAPLWLTGCKEDNSAEVLTELKAQIADLDQQAKAHGEILANLTAENEQLKQDLAKKPEPAKTSGVAADPYMSTGFLAAVEAFVASKIDEGGGVTEARLQDAVQAQLAAEEEQKELEAEERREQRRQSWAEQRAKREEQQLEEAAEEIGMNDEQKAKYEAADANIRKTMQATMAEIRGGNAQVNPQNIMQTFDSLQAKHEADVSEFLDEKQMEAYRARRERQMGWINRIGAGFGRPNDNRNEQE